MGRWNASPNKIFSEAEIEPLNELQHTNEDDGNWAHDEEVPIF